MLEILLFFDKVSALNLPKILDVLFTNKMLQSNKIQKLALWTDKKQTNTER